MTLRDPLTEAEAQYLTRIREDCRILLGPDAEVLEVRREPVVGGARLVVRYRLAVRELESAASGETIVAAHAALRDRIVIDRLRFGYADLVEPR